MSLDLDLKYPDWSIVVVVRLLVNLSDLFTFLDISSFQFKGCVPARSTSQLAVCQNLSADLCSLCGDLHAMWAWSSLLSLPFSILHFPKRPSFPFSAPFFFLEDLFTSLGYQPLARGVGLGPSTALVYIPGGLGGIGRSNSSWTEFSTCGFFPLEEVPTPAARGNAPTQSCLRANSVFLIEF